MAAFPRIPTALACLLAAAIVPTFVIGCGPPQSVTNAPEHYDMGSLEEVGQIYLATFTAKKKPPASMKDLVKADLFVGGYNAIKNGEIIVYWGVIPTPGDAAGEGAGEILAYKSDVPTKGGYVLLKDLTTPIMTAEEFQAAPKPAGPTSADTKPDAKKGS
ncbi:hypothetical protein [Paludisphaera soli]|uniref:hypothetical protein n=1 Tax=Paludisphaera soli TaxID=2712865 RepID=UPI0013EBA8DB|nr:hypothetical protein [Paludisphaera soli]